MESFVYHWCFPGVQGFEELEKDHAGPQQNKHNPAFCLQGRLTFIIVNNQVHEKVDVHYHLKLCVCYYVIMIQGISNLEEISLRWNPIQTIAGFAFAG